MNNEEDRTRNAVKVLNEPCSYELCTLSATMFVNSKALCENHRKLFRRCLSCSTLFIPQTKKKLDCLCSRCSI